MHRITFAAFRRYVAYEDVRESRWWWLVMTARARIDQWRRWPTGCLRPRPRTNLKHFNLNLNLPTTTLAGWGGTTRTHSYAIHPLHKCNLSSASESTVTDKIYRALRREYPSSAYFSTKCRIDHRRYGNYDHAGAINSKTLEMSRK